MTYHCEVFAWKLNSRIFRSSFSTVFGFAVVSWGAAACLGFVLVRVLSGEWTMGVVELVARQWIKIYRVEIAEQVVMRGWGPRVVQGLNSARGCQQIICWGPGHGPVLDLLTCPTIGNFTHSKAQFGKVRTTKLVWMKRTSLGRELLNLSWIVAGIHHSRSTLWLCTLQLTRVTRLHVTFHHEQIAVH